MIPNTPIRIYLAEDDEDDQEFLAEALSRINPSIQLHSYFTGLSFIDSVLSLTDEQLPDLIVLDYNIPELNGAEILKELAKAPRFHNIPKIIWSTSDSDLYRRTCLELGATKYLVKASTMMGISNLARSIVESAVPNEA